MSINKISFRLTNSGTNVMLIRWFDILTSSVFCTNFYPNLFALVNTL